MSTENAELTQATSAKWIIKVGKEAYEADDSMIELVKQADKQGHRGMIHFKHFSISIPHIQSMHQVKTPPLKWNEVKPEDLEIKPLTDTEKAFYQEHLNKLRKKLASK